MIGDLLTLPLTLGVRAANLALQSTEAVVSRGLTAAAWLTRRGASTAAPGAGAPREASRSHGETRPSRSNGGDPSAPAKAPPRDPRASVVDDAERLEPTAALDVPEVADPTPDIYAETVPPPRHVPEEPELVGQFAEPGAEDGAGAAVRIEEPWHGYGQLTAKDAVERIAAASAAELAAVSLYESTHQNRRTVLSAVERALTRLSAGRD